MHETILRKTLVLNKDKFDEIQALFSTQMSSGKEEFYSHSVGFYDGTTAKISVYTKKETLKICVKWFDQHDNLLHTEYSTEPLGTKTFTFATPLFAYELIIEGR